MSNYRKIWENVNGTIPHDLNERRMEIHHIDGNRENNEIDNRYNLSVTDKTPFTFSGARTPVLSSLRVSISHTRCVESRLAE